MVVLISILILISVAIALTFIPASAQSMTDALAAYTSIMNGCDALVFTAGIGENQKRIREKICTGIFSHFKKTPKILVIPTNEELMIAWGAYRLINRDCCYTNSK